MRIRLNEKKVSLAQPGAKAYVVWDTHTTGLGCKVYPGGARRYVLSYRVDGRKRLATLGRCSDLRLREARDLAAAELIRIRSGKLDPLSRRREAREAPTVDDALARFFDETVPERKALGRLSDRTARDYQHYARRYVAPALGRKRVKDVTRDDVQSMAKTLVHTPVQRNRVLAFLSRFFNVLEDWEWRSQHSNPVRRVVRAREEPRERVLSEEELGALSLALEELEVRHPVAVSAIRVASVTGLRIGEVISMRWDDVDIDTGRVLLPTTKTGPRHHDLPEPALAVLKSMPRISDFVFTSGRSALSYGWVRKVFVAAVEASELRDVRLHDLRRTIITMAAATGINSYVLRDFLGHRTTAMADRYIMQLGAPVRKVREQVGAELAQVMRKRGRDGASARRED